MKKYINRFAIASLAMAGLMTTSCELTEDNPAGGDAQLNLFLNWKGLQAVSYSTLNDELYTASDWFISWKAAPTCGRQAATVTDTARTSTTRTTRPVTTPPRSCGSSATR